MLYDKRWDAEVKPLAPWRKVLLDAADIIRDCGLTKGEQKSLTGSVCLHGALSIAITGEPYADHMMPVYCEAWHAVHRQLNLPRAVKSDAHLGAEWNNAPERTPEDVIAVLEAAARENTGI